MTISKCSRQALRPSLAAYKRWGMREKLPNQLVSINENEPQSFGECLMIRLVTRDIVKTLFQIQSFPATSKWGISKSMIFGSPLSTFPSAIGKFYFLAKTPAPPPTLSCKFESLVLVWCLNSDNISSRNWAIILSDSAKRQNKSSDSLVISLILMLAADETHTSSQQDLFLLRDFPRTSNSQFSAQQLLHSSNLTFVNLALSTGGSQSKSALEVPILNCSYNSSNLLFHGCGTTRWSLLVF